ncbi:hypothetical protein FRC07_014027 [Ceratobasidium sp. 392]|nr:hypothetical protein FRC07_014027 [Ceratobasidium sp. 392]
MVELAGKLYDRFMTTGSYLEVISMSDMDISTDQMTETLSSLMAALGTQRRTRKSQAAGNEPPADVALPVEETAGPTTRMDVDEPQELADDSESDGSSSTETVENINLTSGVPQEKLGDVALGNAILLMRDAFWYLEFATAITEGDIGRVFEIMKVLRFSFWGGGSNNYGNELLEVACNYFYEYPADLQTAILNNYLVNPSGLPGHWHELDLLQEHHNLSIKRVFNKKNSEFDSDFLRRAVSVNVRGFGQLRDSLMHMLGLSSIPIGRSMPQYEHDIDVLATHYRRSTLFNFQSGRSQAFTAEDTFSLGYEKLKATALERFLDRTIADPEQVSEEGDEPAEMEELEEPPVPLALHNGVLGPAQGPGVTALAGLYA